MCFWGPCNASTHTYQPVYHDRQSTPRGGFLVRRQSTGTGDGAIGGAGEASPTQSRRRGSVPLEQASSASVPPHATKSGSPQYHSVTVHQLRTSCHYMSPATLRLGIEHLIQV